MREERDMGNDGQKEEREQTSEKPVPIKKGKSLMAIDLFYTFKTRIAVDIPDFHRQ
jgi:hypothetical protein